MLFCRQSFVKLVWAYLGLIQLRFLITGNRYVLKYRLPLNEIIVDFYDTLKSVTSGFASFDYDHDDYVESRLVRVDFLINR